VREFKDLITIFRKRFNLVEKTIRKIDARLFNKIAYFGESFDKIRNDIITIEKKVSGMIIDRDYVINVFARIIDNGFKSGYFA
jgi:hypothetical protein